MPNHCVAQSVVGMAVATVAFTWIAASPAWGAEWKSIAEEDSKIVFDAPGLAGGTFFYKRGDNFSNEDHAYWRGSGGMPVVEIYLLRLAPNRIFRTDHDLKKYTGQWNFLSGKDLKFTGAETIKNAVGRVEYRRFTADGLHCFSFLQGWGSSAGWDAPTFGVPPNYLTGYYCDRSALSDDTVNTVLGGIGVRGYKVPVSAAAKFTPQQMGSFDGDWVLEILEPTFISNGVKVNTKIVDNEFSAIYSAGRWSGEVSGKIDAAGTLLAKFSAINSTWKAPRAQEILATVIREFSTEYVNGSFQYTVSAGSNTILEFGITLTRVSP